MIDPPILVTGIPRSGTSMVAGLLHKCGVWTGPTTPPSEQHNPMGFFENRPIKEVGTYGILRKAGYHRLGQDPIPMPWQEVRINFDLKQAVEKIIISQGYPGGPWLFKDGKMLLLWQAWQRAFPESQWVVCKRDPAAVITSCMRTRFMQAYNTTEGWGEWYKVHEQHIGNLLKNSQLVPPLIIETDELLKGDFSSFLALAGMLNLNVPDDIERFYIPKVT